MKRRDRIALPLLFVVTTCLLPASASMAGEDSWFDLENCGFCKNLGAELGLMDNIMWETHIIENGSLTITQVAASHQGAYDRAVEKIEKVAAKMQAGEMVEMCNFCQSYGGLMMMGAKMESVETATGEISLMTSADPKVIEKIHAHAKRTVDEYEKMLAAEADHDHDHGHEGHHH